MAVAFGQQPDDFSTLAAAARMRKEVSRSRSSRSGCVSDCGWGGSGMVWSSVTVREENKEWNGLGGGADMR